MLPRILHNPALWTPATIAISAIVHACPWMAFAGTEIGVVEKSGAENNPKVVEYLKTCNASYNSDETDWCGAFVNWCLGKAGIKGAFHPEGALWWVNYGRQLPKDDPPFGAIGVFQRTFVRNGETKTSGHVGFIIGQIDNRQGQDKYIILGGNQSETGNPNPCVCVRVEQRKWLSTRYPPL